MKFMDLMASDKVCARLFRRIRWPEGVYCPHCRSRDLKGHGNYARGFKRYLCKACGQTFNDKTDTFLHYSRISLREWIMLIALFTCLHNSLLSLGWLLERSYMPLFKAFKVSMRRLRAVEAGGMDGAVESDEIYVKAGLKGRNNSQRIRRLGRKPRHRGLKRRGRGTWDQDKPPIFVVVGRGGGEDYVPSSDVKAETALKVIGRRVPKGSKVYTDSFKAYFGLKEAGYAHEAVNHSAGEWVRGEVHINGCENRASLFRPWLAVHRGVCKDNLSLYLAAFRACRRSRRMMPVRAITEILKAILIFLALLALLRSRPAPKPPSKGQPQHS